MPKFFGKVLLAAIVGILLLMAVETSVNQLLPPGREATIGIADTARAEYVVWWREWGEWGEWWRYDQRYRHGYREDYRHHRGHHRHGPPPYQRRYHGPPPWAR